VAAVERENLASAFVLQRPNQHFSAMYFCHRFISKWFVAR
jgi:hypothetical protein